MTSQLKSFCYLLALSLGIVALASIKVNHIIVYSTISIALAISLAAYWYSGPIALRLTKARELTEAEAPLLYEAIAELATKDNIPMPQVYCTPAQSIKAFAAGRDPQHSILFVTEGFAQLNNPEELQKKLVLPIMHISKRSVMLNSLILAISICCMPFFSDAY